MLAHRSHSRWAYFGCAIVFRCFFSVAFFPLLSTTESQPLISAVELCLTQIRWLNFNPMLHLLSYYMHLLWSNKNSAFSNFIHTITKQIRKQNLCTTIAMHRPTLMSLVRIRYLHIECFSICAVRRLAGARYFCMAILCYEIPCCFFFHSG